MAQSGLARLTGGQKVAGSNPVAPTKNREKGRFPSRGFFTPVEFSEGLPSAGKNKLLHILNYCK